MRDLRFSWGLSMSLVSQRWALPVRRAFLLCVAAAALGWASTQQAHADVTQVLSTTSNYTYDVVPGLPGLNGGTGDTGVFQITPDTPGLATDIQVNYASIFASDASFFFLHNIQCKGYCSVSVVTNLTNTITNTGTDTVNLRLDSNITAGHLGLVQNATTPSDGIFQFAISEMKGAANRQLYRADGQVSSSGTSIITSDGSVFNGLTSYADPAQIGLDWTETPLSALLDPLAPGETTIVTYSSITYLNAYGLCTDVTRCDGVQVAFGDPRNNGGIIVPSAFAGSTLQEDAEQRVAGLIDATAFDGLTTASLLQPVGFVLDRGFNTAQLRLNAVIVSSVPEPGSWAMMIMGFAIGGVGLRHSRGARQVPA